MVQKTSHRGVHSGNTLRAFNSRYVRNYHKQACIVSRVRPELLQKLQEHEPAVKSTKKQADDIIKKLGTGLRSQRTDNVAVNVALSLNKQARRLLPFALIQQIRANDIADPELTVSVLERHKLKRPANCVSFHSNKGEVKRIQSRNGRYFGFAFPRADGKTKRTLKRERRQKLEETLRANADQVPKDLLGKTVEVFTEQGKSNIKGDTEIGESEVRYEVFYPTPASSSLAHNPKYIRRDADPRDPTSGGAAGDDEHVQHGKPRKRHRGKRRQRMTLKDVDDWELAAYRHSEASPTLQTLTTISHTIDPEEFSSLCDDVREERSTAAAVECLLSSLVEKAQRLRNFKGTTAALVKPRGKKNKTRLRKEEGDDGGHNKSHIVYLGQSQEPEAAAAQDQMSDGKSEEPAPSPVHPISPMPSECTRVLLPKDDVSAAGLKECFGGRYIEGSCQPRKFILDVTASVREVLKKQGIQAKVAEQTEMALSYLVCVHDGFYDDDYDVFRVMLNSRLHDGLLSVEMIGSQDLQGLFRGTVMSLISRTMDFVQGLVTGLKEKRSFPLFIPDQTTAGRSQSPRHLSNHLGSSEVYVPSVERVFQSSAVIAATTDPASDVAMMSALSDLTLDEEPTFCDVCYDDVSPLTLGSAPRTSLPTCRHLVCDNCWSQHIQVRLREGFVRVTCPGHDCQQEVKVGVLLSVVPVGMAEKLLQRQEEIRIGASQTEKWCPNGSCGRVISLKAASLSSSSSSSSGLSGPQQFQQDVVCVCGTHVCFSCMAPAHWPASCKQAEDYRAKVATAGAFPDRLDEIHDDSKIEELARAKRKMQEKRMMLVEGKHCPKCKSFVFKNGGCPQMTCRCGQRFCWFCGRAGYSHPGRRGCVDEEEERKLTTTIIVHHLDQEEDPNDAKQQQQQGNRRQRMSLMERAVEHRKHRQHKSRTNSRAIDALAKAVTSAATKNPALMQPLVTACHQVFPASSSSSSSPSSFHMHPHHHHHPASASLLGMVTAFLKNADHSRCELLEVVEYSLVLLKDLPDSLLRRRALRISEDLSAFCSFSQSVFDVWGKAEAGRQGALSLQEAVKALMRLAEIQGWVSAALDAHVVTVKKLRGLHSSPPGQ